MQGLGADLAGHTSLYFIGASPNVQSNSGSELQNAMLASGVQLVGASSVFAQLELIRYGAGIGTLPVYLAEQQRDLVRLLPDELEFSYTYWLSALSEIFTRPEVRVVCRALEERAHAMLDR